MIVKLEPSAAISAVAGWLSTRKVFGRSRSPGGRVSVTRTGPVASRASEFLTSIVKATASPGAAVARDACLTRRIGARGPSTGMLIRTGSGPASVNGRP